MRIMTTAVTASVVQRMASFCSLGMSMMPSVAIAGKKTIKESRKTGLIASIPGGSRFPVAVFGVDFLVGERWGPEKGEQQVNGEGPDHDEHHILANAPGL